MPRTARVVLAGYPHHVTQRGNNRQDVFLAPEDRRRYLAFLRQQCDRHGIAVSGYCLMTNHVHLVLTPPTSKSLAPAVGQTTLRYALYFNAKYDRVGHLWQDRFYSCALGEDYLLAVLGYVERNPVAAGLVTHAWQYEWSSARAHVGGNDPAGLIDRERWQRELRGTPDDWRQMLMTELGEIEIEEVRTTTSSGRPLVGDDALTALEAQLGRRLRPGPMGRPRLARK